MESNRAQKIEIVPKTDTAGFKRELEQIRGMVERANAAMQSSLSKTGSSAQKGVEGVKEALQQALGAVATPLLQVVLPAVNAVVQAFTQLLYIVGAVLAVLFGKVGTAAQSAAGKSTAAATAAAKAGKAARNAQASIDELNVNSSGTGSGGGNTAAVNVVPEEEPESPLAKWIDRLTGLLEPLRKALAGLWAELERLGGFAWAGLLDFYRLFLQPLGAWVLGEGLPRLAEVLTAGLAAIDWGRVNGALATLWQALMPFAVRLGEGLLWFAENVLAPLGTWVMNEALPAFLNALAAVIPGLEGHLATLGEAFRALWENALLPMLGWVGDGILAFLGWVSENGELVAGLILALVAGIIAYNGAMAVCRAVTGAMTAVMGFLASPVNLVALAIGALIGIIVLLALNWDKMKEAALSCWEGIKEGWQAVAGWFNRTIVQPIAGFFGGLWDGIRAGAGLLAGYMRDKVIDPVVGLFRGMYNAVVGIVEGMVNGFIGIVNGFIGGINGVVGVINRIPGVSLPGLATLGAVSVPRLAGGAVIPPRAEFLAVLGDQRSGRNLEAPESLIRQIVREESGGKDDKELLPLVVELDGGVLYRAMERVRRERGATIGGAFANAY